MRRGGVWFNVNNNNVTQLYVSYDRKAHAPTYMALWSEGKGHRKRVTKSHLLSWKKRIRLHAPGPKRGDRAANYINELTLREPTCQKKKTKTMRPLVTTRGYHPASYFPFELAYAPASKFELNRRATCSHSCSLAPDAVHASHHQLSTFPATLATTRDIQVRDGNQATHDGRKRAAVQTPPTHHPATGIASVFGSWSADQKAAPLRAQ